MNKAIDLIEKCSSFESKTRSYDLPGSKASIKLRGMDPRYMDNIGTNILHIIMSSDYMKPFKDKKVKVTIDII